MRYTSTRRFTPICVISQATVKDFLYLYKHGMLPRGQLFSMYYPKLLKETEALFRLFYCAKDFDTFYKTAAWARIYVNEMQFYEAMYMAVIRRDDTKFIQLPPLYEIYPYLFFNSEVLNKAHHAKVFGKLGEHRARFLADEETCCSPLYVLMSENVQSVRALKQFPSCVRGEKRLVAE